MQTILVVDDKASVRTLVREYLTEEGCRDGVYDRAARLADWVDGKKAGG